MRVSLCREWRRKRKYEEQFDQDVEAFCPPSKNDEEQVVSVISQEGALEMMNNSRLRKYPKIENRDRSEYKNFWTNGYADGSNDEFKERINRD